MTRRFNRKQAKEGENLDRWLVSYADFITLLFAFFVVLYAISSVNEGKYRILSDSLIDAFEVVPRSLKPVQIGDINRVKRDVIIEQQAHSASSEQQEFTSSGDEQMQGNLKAMADEIQSAMKELIDKDLITLRRSDSWLEIEINTSILFPSAEARFSATAQPLLRQIAAILSPFPNPINVEGFTDNLPIHTEQYLSNWELSAARAASVVHLFTGAGIEPVRLSAIGYGEHRPVADNATAEGRAKNRRVVLAVLAKDLNVRLQNALDTMERRPQDGTGFPKVEIK